MTVPFKNMLSTIKNHIFGSVRPKMFHFSVKFEALNEVTRHGNLAGGSNKNFLFFWPQSFGC